MTNRKSIAQCHGHAMAWATAALVTLAMFAPATAFAVQPNAKTVPWVATSPLVPHDTFSGESHMLKGTSDVAGATIEYTWDFGDGSPVQTGIVVTTGTAGNNRNLYGIDAAHVYTGAVGTIFTARLTVRDTSTNETDSANYYVEIRERNLVTEINVAIDRGLWFLHRTMNRTTVSSTEVGDWLVCPASAAGIACAASAGYYGVTPTNLNAFLSNGHLETGSPDNPYTETVQRGMRRVFQLLDDVAIPALAGPAGGQFNPDGNGNAAGIWIPQGQEFYQSGGFMDAIVATGTPNAVVTTGPIGVVGKTYRTIVQDMVDYLAYCQYDDARYGGWRYSCNNFPDNSANQWVAIGIVAAQRGFGATIAPEVKTYTNNWLTYSQAADGSYGYTSPSGVWGPYAVTPSGLVQNVFVGQGRGNAKWDDAETFLRDRFHFTGGAGGALKGYYYGMFSFTKSMLLHDSNNDGIAEPITLLHSSTAGVNDIDWYAAEKAAGAETVNNTDGVARTLVDAQNPVGYWYCHEFSGEQCLFETAWAILMLNRSVFEGGQPVAVASAVPNPAVVGQTISLSGAASFHQDPARHITSWVWDLDNNGTFETTGVTPTTSFPAVANYPVKLRVCDDGTPVRCADTTVTVIVSTPPLAPTANAGGPYAFCQLRPPYFLNGTGSVNPDEGVHEVGQPGDTITAYDWDLDGDGQFDDATGAQPNVTANFPSLGSFLIQLRVTDRTATSFPSSGLPNLSDTDSAIVKIAGQDDPVCSCISNLAARPKPGKVQLTWTYGALPAGGHYNVYRGTITGGPYLKIAETASTYSTYLDSAVVNGTAYYYVVRPSNAAGAETCQSNEASARPTAR